MQRRSKETIDTALLTVHVQDTASTVHRFMLGRLFIQQIDRMIDCLSTFCWSTFFMSFVYSKSCFKETLRDRI